jgi:hypothetical protein
MTRGKYNEYRGWAIPADEDPTDEGYLVVYNRGTADHYESWSPKKQLDDGYTELVPGGVPFEHIEEMIKTLTFKFARVEDTTVTGCWAYLPNGFQIGYGQSACIDPADYRKSTGEHYALERCRADSKDKLWALEGYLKSVTGCHSPKVEG